MDRRVVVFTQPGCSFCKRATEFLTQKGIAFEERDIAQDDAAADELDRLGVYATPTITVDAQIVIGFNQKRLEELLS